MTGAEALVPSIGFTLIAEVLFLWFRHSKDADDRASASERAGRRLAAATAYVQVMLLVTAMVKIASHFGWAPHEVQEIVFPALGIPLIASAAHYFKALWDVKREKEPKPS